VSALLSLSRPCYQAAMSSVEYGFAGHIDFARNQGWRACSRATWLKPDGTTVHFLSLLVRLEIVAPGETVHVIGYAPEPLRKLKKLRALTLCHA
jgi:hypothetical protein